MYRTITVKNCPQRKVAAVNVLLVIISYSYSTLFSISGRFHRITWTYFLANACQKQIQSKFLYTHYCVIARIYKQDGSEVMFTLVYLCTPVYNTD